MSVYTWNNPHKFNPRWTQDEVLSSWVINPPCCVMCGDAVEAGQKVWSWHGAQMISAHASCMAKRATGICRDLAECAK